MGNYNFWADLLFTFQSSPDWIKALWLLMPPGFLLAAMAMVMRFRLALQRDKAAKTEQATPFRYPDNPMLELDDFPALPDELEALALMLPTPLCPVSTLPHKGKINP